MDATAGIGQKQERLNPTAAKDWLEGAQAAAAGCGPVWKVWQAVRPTL